MCAKYFKPTLLSYQLLLKIFTQRAVSSIKISHLKMYLKPACEPQYIQISLTYPTQLLKSQNIN